MNISKAFFFFNFLFIINYLIIPSLCTNNTKIPNIKAEEHALEELDENIEKQKKKKKLILYSTLGTVLALAASAALGFGIHKWRKSKKKDEEIPTKTKVPIPVPEKTDEVPVPDEKEKPPKVITPEMESLVKRYVDHYATKYRDVDLTDKGNILKLENELFQDFDVHKKGLSLELLQLASDQIRNQNPFYIKKNSLPSNDNKGAVTKGQNTNWFNFW